MTANLENTVVAKGLLKSLLQHHSLKASLLWYLPFSMVQLSHLHDYWKNHSFNYMQKERYIHLNAEFQRIARRDKKTFFSDQHKEIEESNRMGMTRDLFKKIRDTKGIFHAKMDSIKDRNCMDLTEAEDIKKRWQEYTEEVYKKDLHDPDNHNGVITHLEPDILECEVKWALGRINRNKASGGIEYQ